MKTKAFISILTLALAMQAQAGAIDGTARIHVRGLVPRNCSMQLKPTSDALIGAVSGANSAESGSIGAAPLAQNSEVLVSYGSDLRDKDPATTGLKQLQLQLQCNDDFVITVQSLNGGLQNQRAEDGSQVRGNIPYEIVAPAGLVALAMQAQAGASPLNSAALDKGGQALSSNDIMNGASFSVNLADAQANRLTGQSDLMKGAYNPMSGASTPGQVQAATNAVVNGTANFQIALNSKTDPNNQPDFPAGEYIDTVTISMSQP